MLYQLWGLNWFCYNVIEENNLWVVFTRGYIKISVPSFLNHTFSQQCKGEDSVLCFVFRDSSYTLLGCSGLCL